MDREQKIERERAEEDTRHKREDTTKESSATHRVPHTGCQNSPKIMSCGLNEDERC